MRGISREAEGVLASYERLCSKGVSFVSFFSYSFHYPNFLSVPLREFIGLIYLEIEIQTYFTKKLEM